MIPSLAASTVAFFVVSHFTKRWLDDNDVPKGMTRGTLVFTVALAAAYGVGWAVQHLV